MILKLISEVLAGTQVQRSMNMLGTATQPWDDLRKELSLFGWIDSTEIEAALRERVTEVATAKPDQPAGKD